MQVLGALRNRPITRRVSLCIRHKSFSHFHSYIITHYFLFVKHFLYCKAFFYCYALCGNYPPFPTGGEKQGTLTPRPQTPWAVRGDSVFAPNLGASNTLCSVHTTATLSRKRYMRRITFGIM